jgi:predicted benzoate:H+ symporter BenE
MEIAMHQAAHIVAAALAAICLGLIAAMPIVAGWGTPMQARQITDFSTKD